MSQQVQILHGPPACGKSTYAKELTLKDKSFKRLCRDDYREMLDNYSLNNDLENVITKMFMSDFEILLRAGYSVLLDNTNLRPKYITEYMKVIKKVDPSIFVRIVSFENVDYNELLNRDSKRARPVGKDVIDKMMKQLKTNNSKSLEKIIYQIEDSGFQKYINNSTKPKAIIVDIDGTIAHRKDRSPYDWKRVGEDEPDKVIRDLLWFITSYADFYQDDDIEIIYLSGRDSVCRQETMDWLNLHNFPDGMLYMRAENDVRKDSIVKYELFDTHIRNNYNVLFVLDDRNQVVQMWRDIGLKCLQVAEGNF